MTIKIEMRSDHEDFDPDAVPKNQFLYILVPVRGGYKPFGQCTAADLKESIDIAKEKIAHIKSEVRRFGKARRVKVRIN